MLNRTKTYSFLSLLIIEYNSSRNKIFATSAFRFKRGTTSSDRSVIRKHYTSPALHTFIFFSLLLNNKNLIFISYFLPNMSTSVQITIYNIENVLYLCHHHDQQQVKRDHHVFA